MSPPREALHLELLRQWQEVARQWASGDQSGVDQKKTINVSLACSGGLDSVVLFHLLREIAETQPISLSVIYVHHGPAEQEGLSEYRLKAQVFVEELCAKWEVPFFTNTKELWPKASLRSEQELRDYRRETLLHLGKESLVLALAHHEEDLLETRMMRLIRGTSLDGLKAMKTWSKPWWRPLLQTSRKRLEELAQSRSWDHVEDPSNVELDPLRNWMRHSWLQELEERQPGAQQALKRSLQTIVQQLDNASSYEACFEGRRLKRQELLSRNLAEQRQIIALFLQKQEITQYGLSHINEALKRLDVIQKDLNFRLLKRIWRVDAEHVWCEPLKQAKLVNRSGHETSN